MTYWNSDHKPVKKPKKVKPFDNRFWLKSGKLKPIRKVSKRTSKKMGEYSRLKKSFIVGKICPIYPHLPCVDIHHMKGRTGDLLLNTEFWLAVSRKGHMRIELNPSWAREQGFSLPRH